MPPNNKITDFEAQQVLLFNLLRHCLALFSTKDYAFIPLSEDETKLPEKFVRRMEGYSEGKVDRLAQMSGKTVSTFLNVLKSPF